MRKFFGLLGCVLCVGCATVSGIAPKLSIGMTKEEVLKQCGQPYTMAATIDKSTGRPLEALAYRERVKQTTDGLFNPGSGEIITNIFLIDGKVIQYGPADKLLGQ